MFPGVAEFCLVIALVVVMPVEAGKQRDARARDGTFETCGLGNDEVGRDPAIGPAANTELIGISDALRDSVIHYSHVVLIVLVAPVSVNGCKKFLTVAGRAARI